jgi:hypothetical protein
VRLAGSTLTDAGGWAIAAGGALAAIRWRVHPAWIVLAGAALGWLVR